MATMHHDALDALLAGLMARYYAHVPDVPAILATMARKGLIASDGDIENDHVAFRTIGVKSLGIASLEKVFLRHGYRGRDRYDFPEKKVVARWYSPPGEAYPRIFISELCVSDLSQDAQAIIRRCADPIQSDPVDALDLEDGSAVVEFLHQPLWPLPSWEEYERLAAESEYAAWAIYNRYYLNHFTIAIHDLPQGYNTVAEFNRFLEENGFTLNDAGGKIKTSADGKLLQSSTVAALVEAPFPDGTGGFETHRIPGSYVEFIERRPLDIYADLPPGAIRREHRREGFEARSADRIFESTFDRQAKRRARR